MLAYAVRHAESLTNAGRDGGLNSALSPLGKRQVEALVERFAATPITAVYSSPFWRCLETALPIAERIGLPVRLRPELSEHHHLEPGTPADMGLDDVDTIVGRHPGAIACPDFRERFDWPPADESFDGVVRRTRSFARFLKARWTGTDDLVLLMSHGSPVARLIEAWLTDQPGPWFRFTIDNAAVAALRFHEGVSSLVCLNEISHLRGLPPPGLANFREDGSIKPQPPSSYW
jgi:probable phosphoglycerate mutase